MLFVLSLNDKHLDRKKKVDDKCFREIVQLKRNTKYVLYLKVWKNNSTSM